MKSSEIRAGGYYSLLSDKGTDVIARESNGKPIIGFINRSNGTMRAVFSMSGGCDEKNYCAQADPQVAKAVSARKETLLFDGSKIQEQEIYPAMIKSEEIGFVSGHAYLTNKYWFGVRKTPGV